MTISRNFLIVSLLTCVTGTSLAADVPVYTAHVLNRYDAPESLQGVAVSGAFFYAVTNNIITKQDKASGQPVMGWKSSSDAIVHLDSGVIEDGKIYAAHSNYPAWPMASSVEIRDAGNLRPVASHAFDIDWGSLTWIDRHDGAWWGAFAGYDRVQPGQDHPYGGTASTRIVKMNDEFTILQQWSLPDALLARMTPMSNSGGSWGPDGYLYLTGHDHPEIYVVAAPDAGAELAWIATVAVDGLNGQGIAWDRSTGDRELWAVQREDRQVLRLAMPAIAGTD